MSCLHLVLARVPNQDLLRRTAPKSTGGWVPECDLVSFHARHALPQPLPASFPSPAPACCLVLRAPLRAVRERRRRFAASAALANFGRDSLRFDCANVERRLARRQIPSRPHCDHLAANRKPQPVRQRQRSNATLSEEPPQRAPSCRRAPSDTSPRPHASWSFHQTILKSRNLVE